MSEFDAVKVLLESVPLLSGRVRDTVHDRDGGLVRDNYVVLYGAGPDSLDDGRYGSIPRPDSDAEYTLPGKAVGMTPGVVRDALTAVRSIVGRKPVVPGRRCDPVTIEFESVKVDNSVSPPLYFSDFFVSFTSRRG